MVDYLPIVIQALVAIVFSLVTVFLVPKLGPKLHSRKKDMSFECGLEPVGDARFPIPVRYFVVAILFVLFDVEVIFFYPYAVNFNALQLDGLIAVAIFVGFFLTGFIYIYKKGALTWDNYKKIKKNIQQG